MHPTRLMTVAFLAMFVAAPAFGQAAPAPAPKPQPRVSPAKKADSDALRALVAKTPTLPFERVELAIHAPKRLGDISAITADKHGNIYIFQRPNAANGTLEDPVVVVDAQGHFLRSFGKGLDPMAHGIKIDPAGNVWTVDAHTSMVRKFTPQGKLLLQVNPGEIPHPDRPFCGATDIAFEKNGHFLISDGYCNARVIEYSAGGRKIRQWGTPGTGSGEFHLVHDVSVAPDGTIFVADRENGRVQWFSPSGKYLGEKHFGGQVFSAQVASNGMVYVGTHASDAPTYDVDSNIFELDPKSGRILGRVEGFAHQLSIGADGSLYPGMVNVRIGHDPNVTSILVYRPRSSRTQ